MCGISGYFSSRGISPDLLDAMADVLVHRGPDDRGIWYDADAGIGLAHRRLAIVDLSPGGAQPMVSADGRWVLSYNGEVYNHLDLRARIEAADKAPPGSWRGHSDTETLVEAIAAWGLAATLDRAVGMFAIALWDRADRRLTLARDRFGEKPLYFGWAGRDFVFGSELKALRCHPDFDASIDRGVLGLYAMRNYVPAPWSIHRGTYKLPPGCILSLDLAAAGEPRAQPPQEGATGSLSLTRYWSYPAIVRAGLDNPITDRAEALDALEQSLAAAVGAQAVADVPVGAFVSGGIDSSTIVALYQRYSATPVHSFSIGFEEKGYDESTYARAVAAHLGTVHHEQIVTAADARDVIPSLPYIYDEPFADSSQVPTCLVSRFARSQVTVAISGDGGDELFGGYNRHRDAPRLWRQLARIPAPLRALGGQLLGRLPPALWSRAVDMLPGSHQPHVGAKIYKGLGIAGSASDLGDLYNRFLAEWSVQRSPVIGAGVTPAPWSLAPDDGSPDAVRIMACDATSYLPDDILCKVDRASMAVSLETRVPFLDHRVAAVAARIPIDMKIDGGGGKLILRSLLYRHVPKALFDRPKAGFAVPIGTWLRGPLRPWAEELLDERRLASEGWFDPRAIRRRWEDHLAGKSDSTAALWSVLMFQAWLDRA
jgi:asparagine synthase (glutamine-hydrolysing)